MAFHAIGDGNRQHEACVSPTGGVTMQHFPSLQLSCGAVGHPSSGGYVPLSLRCFFLRQVDFGFGTVEQAFDVFAVREQQ